MGRTSVYFTINYYEERFIMARISTTVVFFFLMASVHAMNKEVVDINVNRSDRSEEQRNQLPPDGLVFMQTLGLVDAISSSEEGSAPGLIKDEMGLDENEAKDFVYLMRSTNRFINAETKGVEARVSCESGVPRASGNEVYQILDAIPEEMISIAAKHLRLFKQNIGTEKAARFQQWLDREKAKNPYSKSDYKEHFERRGISPDTVIARICGTE
jgi:hypothetical protein